MNAVYVDEYRKRVEHHRELVAEQCQLLGVNYRQALIHDLSKFSPAEQPFYIAKFTVPRLAGSKPSPDDEAAFLVAVKHHYECNPHHPEHWRDRPMPECYIREMVADWQVMGIEKNNSPDLVMWLSSQACWDKFDLMHQETIDILWPLLHELGYVDGGHLGWYKKSYE